MDQDDPEKRIAELERQLAEQKRIAELERQLAEAKAAAQQWQATSPSGPAVPPRAAERIAGLAGEMAQAWQEHLRTGNDWGAELRERRDAMNRATVESGISPAQFGNVYSQAVRQAQLDRQFGVRGHAGNSATAIDSRLSPAPRSIPAAFWLAEVLPFRWWYIWILFMVGIAPIGVWHDNPAAFAVVSVLTLVGIYAFQFRGTTKRFALLKWGQVARVTGSRIVSQGTYYSGTTWGMAPLPMAHGWKVQRPLYSGPNTKTQIRYTLNGAQGELVVSGREYYDGVVLADARNAIRALCVTSFAYDLDRDESGNWIGRIRPRLMLGMAVWLIVVIGVLALAALAVPFPAPS